MHLFLREHLDRVKDAVAATFGLGNLDYYIENKTYLNGKKFSFKDHEFQRDVLRGQAPTEITVKIAQVGLSEATYRLALAACRVVDDFSVIYTFPNASDAQNFCKTRIDPIIEGSPDLKSAVNPELNNSEIKQFGRNSFLYMRGTRSQQGAVSVPADMIIHDEWDRSDTTTASMYIARLQHKPHKLRRLFSTPTVDKFGILKEAETARRMRHMASCVHCNYKWLPSYFDDIKIPGFDGDLRELNKHNLKNYKWKQAFLACPKCGRDPQLAYERMEWVCENPDDDYEAVARFISPFTVPNILTPSYLVNNSTQYEKYSEFMNQGLGLAAEEEDDTINESDLEKALTSDHVESSDLHVFAADMGLMCHIMIGRETVTGQMIVVHKERVPLAMFESRRRELLIKYRCCLSIHDSQPYVDLITRLTKSDLNAYGALFATFKSGAIVRIQEQEEDAAEGKMNFRMIKVRRNEALDSLLAVIKRGELVVKKDGKEDDTFKTQMQSLKRVKKFDSNQEMVYAWEKTGEENDHFHFALLYLWCGLRIRGAAVGTGSLLTGMPLMKLVRTKGV